MDTEKAPEPPGAEPPTACSLTNDEAKSRILRWADLRQRGGDPLPITDGVRMTLPASFAGEVAQLISLEAECCSFLAIETSVTDDVLTLDISSSDPAAVPVISALAGIPLS